MIKSVNIIGAGNVATHIAIALRNSLEIKQIASSTFDSAVVLAKRVGAQAIERLTELQDVDLIIVAVSDDAIENVLVTLPPEANVVHTSGSVGIDSLSRFNQFGILYPLQSFSINRDVDMLKIPFMIEASNAAFFKELEYFCVNNLSTNVIQAGSDERATVHLAAVIANNFTTALLGESEGILKNASIDFKILKPLLLETIEKVFENGARASLTGPAVRGDEEVMQTQINRLDKDEMKEIYRLISKLIQSEKT